jgi:hypothetical protein
MKNSIEILSIYAKEIRDQNNVLHLVSCDHMPSFDYHRIIYSKHTNVFYQFDLDKNCPHGGIGLKSADVRPSPFHFGLG